MHISKSTAELQLKGKVIFISKVYHHFLSLSPSSVQGNGEMDFCSQVGKVGVKSLEALNEYELATISP